MMDTKKEFGKVEQMSSFSEVAPEYEQGLVKQIEEAVAKIQFQEERYDELNKKLKVFENAKADAEVHDGLVKKLGDTETELNSQQDQVNRANATIARLREQIEEKKKMRNRIDTLDDKLVNMATATNTASGMGLIKCGSLVIPFDNQISKDTDLYKLYNINIHEKIEMMKAKELLEKSH